MKDSASLCIALSEEKTASSSTFCWKHSRSLKRFSVPSGDLASPLSSNSIDCLSCKETYPDDTQQCCCNMSPNAVNGSAIACHMLGHIFSSFNPISSRRFTVYWIQGNLVRCVYGRGVMYVSFGSPLAVVSKPIFCSWRYILRHFLSTARFTHFCIWVVFPGFFLIEISTFAPLQFEKSVTFRIKYFVFKCSRLSFCKQKTNVCYAFDLTPWDLDRLAYALCLLFFSISTCQRIFALPWAHWFLLFCLWKEIASFLMKSRIFLHEKPRNLGGFRFCTYKELADSLL